MAEPEQEDETPRERYLRVMKLRATNALKALDVAAGVGLNPAYYEYDETDVAKIVGKLRGKVDEVERILLTHSRDEDLDL